jgi:LPS sulfotransferase NodH
MLLNSCIIPRGECACTPVRFFVIVSMQRSGSGWFETLLNSHPNVSSNGEIFAVRERREDIVSILRTLDRLYDLDWRTSAAKNECTAAFGLKWMLNQVSYHCIHIYWESSFSEI